MEFCGYKHHMKHPVKAKNSYLLIGKANFHTLNCFRDSTFFVSEIAVINEGSIFYVLHVL